jgi:hypothetical protein
MHHHIPEKTICDQPDFTVSVASLTKGLQRQSGLSTIKTGEVYVASFQVLLQKLLKGLRKTKIRTDF